MKKEDNGRQLKPAGPGAAEQNRKPGKKVLRGTRMQSIRFDGENLFRENKYYSRIAKRFGICKYALMLIAVVFSIVMLTAYGADLTPSNFQYLLKDLDYSGASLSAEFDTIIYNGGIDSVFAVYRNELAVIHTGMTSLYSSSGAFSFSKSNIFYSPHAETSRKFLLVYDRGNTTCSYAVYNSFTELYTAKMDSPIVCADVADNGYYAIVTKDDTYKGRILIYDDKFHQVGEIKKEKYVLAVEFDPSGSILSTASVYDQYGDYVTEITQVEVGAEEILRQTVCTGSAAVELRYLENGNIALLCTDRFLVYDGELSLLADIPFGSALAVRADLGRSVLCKVYNKTVIGNDKVVEIYDENGELLRTTEGAGELMRITSNGRQVYLLYEDHVQMVDAGTGTEKNAPINPDAMQIVFTADGTPILCYTGSAEVLQFAG